MVLSIVLMGILFSNSLSAKTAREIDVEVEVAIERFHEQVIGAKQLIDASKGMLVMPNVFKGAFLIGGEYGEGALRIDGKTVDYYNTASGSIGIQIGGQKKDIILLFMTDEALQQFRADTALVCAKIRRPPKSPSSASCMIPRVLLPTSPLKAPSLLKWTRINNLCAIRGAPKNLS
jgi:lipid-binding SYLF domain-containing protein